MSEQATERTVKMQAALLAAQQLSALLKISRHRADDPTPGSEEAALMMVLPQHRSRPPHRN